MQMNALWAPGGNRDRGLNAGTIGLMKIIPPTRLSVIYSVIACFKQQGILTVQVREGKREHRITWCRRKRRVAVRYSIAVVRCDAIIWHNQGGHWSRSIDGEMKSLSRIDSAQRVS